MLFDSHCHLTDAAFAGDVEPVLARARAAGVLGLVTIASSLEDAAAAARLAAVHEAVWCTAGVHPHVAGAAHGAWVDELRAAVRRPGVVAIGECGLDYHYDNSPRATQQIVFETQLTLAAELNLPVVVHSRDADEDTAALVRAAPAHLRGVLHCFTGGRSLLDAALGAGWCVSFSGLITFRKYAGADLIRAVPDEALLLETDSPYLAPVPMRGNRNEPGHLVHTCEAAARMRDVEPPLLAAITTRNARAFYGLDAHRQRGTTGAVAGGSQ